MSLEAGFESSTFDAFKLGTVYTLPLWVQQPGSCSNIAMLIARIGVILWPLIIAKHAVRIVYRADHLHRGKVY